MNAPPVTVMLPVTTGRKFNVETVDWTFVRSDDLERLGDISLRRGSHGYAVIKGPGRELLHRKVAGLATGDPRVVDHRDRNPMNNQRHNLRVGTQALNTQNRERTPHCGTRRNHKRWSASVKEGGRTKYLGTFDTREEAAQVARDYRIQHYPFTDEV